MTPSPYNSVELPDLADLALANFHNPNTNKHGKELTTVERATLEALTSLMALRRHLRE